MKRYGKSLREKNGIKLVEVGEMRLNGLTRITGYALLGRDGLEIGFCISLHEAKGIFEFLTVDRAFSHAEDPVEPGPSFGM